MQSSRRPIEDNPVVFQQGKMAYAGNAPIGDREEKPSTGSLSARNFAISMSAAGLSHIVHHPLYTLKSHMMMHGRQFKISIFLKNTFNSPVRFLYRGWCRCPRMSRYSLK